MIVTLEMKDENKDSNTTIQTGNKDALENETVETLSQLSLGA